MRELEFLPGWYGTLHHRKQWVMFQGWLTLGIVIVLASIMGLRDRRLRTDETALKTLQAQVDETDWQLLKLHESQSLQQQLSRQAQIVAKLGPHVPTARLLNVLDSIMPPQIGLLDLSMDDAQVSQKPASALAAANGADTVVDHALNVRLHGVAPTGIDLGNFLGSLAAVPYFTNINPKYSKDRPSAGHVMREFEVTFTINLSANQ